MNLQSSDHPMMSEESTISTVKLTCNEFCVVKYDLQKLIMLSPLVRSVVAELNIPSGLSHLLDVTIMMPGVEVEALVLLVKLLRGEVATVSLTQEANILEVAESLGIELDLGRSNKSNSTNVTGDIDIKHELTNQSDTSLLESSESVDVDESDITVSNENSETVPDISSKAFACMECNSKVSSRKVLKRHINMKHTGKYRTPCDMCGKIFNRKDAMKSHRERMH